MRLRGSVKAVVIQQGYLLVGKKRNDRGVYYSFPGGGQEPGETLVQAMRREMIEAQKHEKEQDSLLMNRVIHNFCG